MKEVIGTIFVGFFVGTIFAVSMAISYAAFPYWGPQYIPDPYSYWGFPFLLDLLHFDLPSWAGIPAFFAGPIVGIALQVLALVVSIRRRFSALTRQQRITSCVTWALLFILFLVTWGYFTMESLTTWMT